MDMKFVLTIAQVNGFRGIMAAELGVLVTTVSSLVDGVTSTGVRSVLVADFHCISEVDYY